MIGVGVAFAAIAALLHIYIFVLESVVFATKGRHVFGVRGDDEARIVHRWAFNQGFYNLFLAVGALVGVVLVVTDDRTVGAALIFFAMGSMFGAGSVLLGTDRALLRGALVQMVPSAVAVVTLAIGLI